MQEDPYCEGGQTLEQVAQGVEFPSSKIAKTQLDVALSNLLCLL